MSSVAFVGPQATVATPQARSDFSKFQSHGPTIGSGYSGISTVNRTLTSMAAMFMVAGGVRRRERRERRSALRAAEITKGATIPDVTLDKGFPPKKVPLKEIIGGKKVIMVGLPGAFTPT